MDSENSSSDSNEKYERNAPTDHVVYDGEVFFDVVDPEARPAVNGHESSDVEAEEPDEIINSEPKLKYERLSSDLRTILAEDYASAIAVHPKFMVLGTKWGRLHLLDALGNELPCAQFNNKFSVAINQISVDHAGEFVAACSSSEGRVVISGLYSRDANSNVSLGMSVNVIAIDPIYARQGSGKRFMTGYDRVILHERTYFSKFKQTPLSEESDGPITCLKWRGRFAAWAGRRGIQVYDVIQERVISLVKFDQPLPQVDLKEDARFVTKISWADQHTLFASQGDVVFVCQIKRRDVNEAKTKDLPEHFVEITSKFKLEDQWVCGVSPLDKLLVLLTVPKGDNLAERRPQLLIVEPFDDDFAEVSTDLLSVRGYENYKPSEYHLEYLLEDKFYFVVSPKDVVVGKPRDEDDHIDWLLFHGSYAEALESAEHQSKLLRRHNLKKVGRAYLDHLIDEAQFDSAGKLCVKLFRGNQKLWQDEIVRFNRLNQLVFLAPYIPLGNYAGKDDAQLEATYYELVIKAFIKSDKGKEEDFLKVIRSWPPELYDVSEIVNILVEELLLQPDNTVLQRALATLFGYQRKYDKAMAMYLKLGHKDVFQLIRKHELFLVIDDKIPDLMELDEREALKLFLEHQEKLPSDLIVSRLKGMDKYLHSYLDALKTQNYDVSKRFHGLLVRLYADYNPDKLLEFLEKSDHYPIKDALEVCEVRGLTHERIFILARMGSTRKALRLIISELADIQKAVEFCKKYDDTDLWNDLIDYSIDKPYFVNVLLHNIGTHVDPTILIKKIERGQKIPGLRDSLVQIMHDYRLQISLQEGCKKILVSDCYSLMERQVKSQSKGISVERDSFCGGCTLPILEVHQSKARHVVVFMCRHAFHIDCIADEPSQCSLCKGSRKPFLRTIAS